MTDIVFLGMNDIGERIYEWLVDRDDATVLALLTEPDQLSVVETLEPDLLISGGFRHIVPEEILEVSSSGGVNVHKSYLPYNRGANPNVWSIIDDGPVGVSLHYMTADIDGGPIIDRREVDVRPDDTGRDLYDRLENEQFEQFVDVWPDIRDDTAETLSQPDATGSYHTKQEFVDLWELDRDETVRVGEFVDRLRALTFPPYRNAYFEAEGDRYYVDLRIHSDDQTENSPTDTKNVPRYTSENND